MQYVDRKKVDKQGRIIISELFREIPEQVTVTVEADSEAILVQDASKVDYGPVLSVDEKNRITIPKWLREEINDRECYLFIDEDNGKHYISPKTGDII